MPPHRSRDPPFHPPSTAATLNLAATAAQRARIWRTIDAAFSGRCLAAAQRAYLAALRNPEIFAVDNFTGSGGYGDQDLSDEFFWATAELLVTTGREEFAEALRRSPFYRGAVHEPGWASTATLGTISLALVPNALGADGTAEARARIVAAADTSRSESGSDTDSHPAPTPGARIRCCSTAPCCWRLPTTSPARRATAPAWSMPWTI
jgi:endoglucanase